MTNTRTIFEESIFVAGCIGASVGNAANLLRLHQIFVALQHEIPQRRDIRSTGRTTDEQLFAFKSSAHTIIVLTAEKLLCRGDSIEDVADITTLTIKELQAAANQLGQ